MERDVDHRQELARLRWEQTLYGAHLFQAREHPSEEIEAYIALQEQRHLAEGLQLQQRSARELTYAEGQVRGFGGQSMVAVCETGYQHAKRQYLAGDQAAWSLMKRREHDVTISHSYNDLMARGAVGDGFFVCTPYAEELADDTAAEQGFWPQFRRSYVWLYRKKSAAELECVEVSIDQSSLATYRELLQEFGTEVSEETQSHDLPAFMIPFHADETGRDELIDYIIQQYARRNKDTAALAAENSFEAVDFLDRHAKAYVQLLVDMHRAIATTIQTGELHDLVRLSATRALHGLDCLSYSETSALQDLLRNPQITQDHTLAFATLLAAQRYGTWEAISAIAGGVGELGGEPVVTESGMLGTIQAIRFIDHIYSNTNQAAALHKTMPGCEGGTSFLQQNEAAVQSTVFNGELYSFKRKMFCVVCQVSPKKGEQPKWCGPCGICQPCDVHIKAKNRLGA